MIQRSRAVQATRKKKQLPGRAVSGKEHNDKDKHFRLLAFINWL